LLWPKRVHAFNGLHLYWRNLLREPATFSRRFARALQLYPNLTLRQLARGFLWKYRPQIETKAYIEDLLHEFNLPPICTPLA
jgi:hypothetical protein